MDYTPKPGQKSGFPKQSAYKAVFYDEVGSYPIFSVQELYQDLFVNNKSKVALITFPNEPHREKHDKSLFYFLLPNEIINKVLAGGKIKETDFQEFLVKKNKGRKITTLLINLFFSEKIDSEKSFVTQVQKHFIKLLKPAIFSNDLKPYLNDFANNVIVPEKLSSNANWVFASLSEKGDHTSLSIIIANFFVSAMIGLYPMKYTTYETDSGERNLKTYLLKGLGMEYVWMPERISEEYIRLQEIQYYYDKGLYAETYVNALHRIIKEREKEKEDKNIEKTVYSEIFRLLGLCLLQHPEVCDPSKLDDGIPLKAYQELYLKHCLPEEIINTTDGVINVRKSDGVSCLLKAVSLDKENNKALYALYDYYRKDKDKEKSIKYLKTAFAQNYAKAVVEVASLYLNGVNILDNVPEESLLEKINYIIKHERRNDVVDVGQCLYLRGRFAIKYGNEAKANEDFEAASKRGNERAKHEITRKKRNERNSFPSFVKDENAPCCYANTFTGNNYTVVSTFPSETWVMYTPDNTGKKDIIQIRGIEEFVEMQNNSGFGHSRFAFLLMSEDEEKNLNDCLTLLDKLFNIVLDKSEDKKWKIIDVIDIFVSAKYETASMLIDANISDMGSDIYFKVHIMDEGRDTVHKLLCEAPLFLPALKKGNKKTEVVLFGSSEMNYHFIKESIACAYLEPFRIIKITLLGENADALENRLHQECPGIYSDTPRISCIKPEFIKCSIKDTDFPSYIYGKICAEVFSGECESSLDTEIVNSLIEANYFVVDYADDLENIRFSADLRTWLLRSKGTFKRAPFIGVKCSDEQNAYLASHLTLSGQASGNAYFNKYDLFPIGISAQTYSYENLIYHPVLNDFALRIHKSYYEDKERAAENDFYSFSYNSDSSISTAIGLCYRFFAAGVIFNDKDKYLNFGFFKTSGIETKFEEMYKEKLENLAALEQSRWNGFMLSRGWESANQSEVQIYKEQSTGWQHKHILAKKHPFIREWEDLDAPKLTDLLNILKSKFDYDRQPQVTTKKSIEDTAKFFNVVDKTDEKLH